MPGPGSTSSPVSKNDVAEHLERRILNGEWTPGHHLPSERELCSEYGVSRPAVREVLAGLVEKVLIDVQPGRGSFVRAVATDELSHPLSRAAARAGVTARDLVHARLALECSAVDFAAQRHDVPAEALRRALAVHEEAVGLDAVAHTDLDFHEALMAASGNPVLVLMFGAIRSQVYALMLRSHGDPAVHQLGEPQHQEILDAITDGDPERARGAMRKHLELALELYGADLDRPLRYVVESRGLRSAAALPPSAAR